MIKIIIISLAVGNLFSASDFLKYSTTYLSYNLTTPHQKTNALHDIDDNYSLTIGIRKIARFEYQKKQKFYDGTEEAVTDKAFIGSVPGWEYLINISDVKINGFEYTDSKFWIRNSTKNLVYKFKYYKIDSRRLEFFTGDIRYRKSVKGLDISTGIALLGHPAFGYDAYADYDQNWWDLAYEYGYTDYTYPLNDLNNNGIIDSYYIWIETDPYTEEGYWEYYYEQLDYYWEDPDGNQVATSDSEFSQYHLPEIIRNYNQDKIDALDYQGSVSLVLGLDYNWSNDPFYFHTWTSIYPISKGITEYAFVDELKYEIGLLLGYKIGSFGVFLEGSYLDIFKEQYEITTGINYQFK
jgi:hypothetical protein